MYNSEAVFLRLFYNCFASCYFGYRCKIFLTEAKLTERKVTRLSMFRSSARGTFSGEEIKNLKIIILSLKTALPTRWL